MLMNMALKAVIAVAEVSSTGAKTVSNTVSAAVARILANM